MLATSPHCAPPGVNSFALPQLKRKRSDSNDSTPGRDAPVATKLRTDNTPPNQISSQQRPPATSAPKDDTSSMPVASLTGQTSERAPYPPPSFPEEGNSDPSAPLRDDHKPAVRKVDIGKLRESLEAQLSLEVLLKHNELRLIDQEIAKCQVALEQLRRCAEIPYPGSQAAGLSQSVSSGTGMAVWAPGNGPAPLSPAPWGVANGPYTRHYSRWLLPDPRFDGGEVELATPMGFGATTPLEGRSTRGNPIDTGYLAGKSTRPQRGSTATKLQSLPSGYPAPKEKAGPMIIRRKSDGVLVKLVCLDCRRDNFSSTQGFINHCRIAHNRNFASHDAAAVASGEPVEVDDAGAVVGGKSEPSTGLTPGFVHPLIRSAHAIEPTPRTPSTSESSDAAAQKPAAQSHGSSTVETPRTLSHTSLGPKTPAMAKASNDTFTASKDTPHLSSLIKLRGVGLDLGQLVGEAKTTVDLDGYSSEEGDSESEPTSPSAEAKPNKPLATRAGRQPMRTTASQTASERPDGHKGIDRPSHQPLVLKTLTPTRPPVSYQSPYAPTGAQMNGLSEVDGVDLSPNTVESNQAPSLVSDDDDYEAASDSDSPGPSSSAAGDGDDFSLIDVEDDEDTTGSTTTSDSNPKRDVGMGSAAKPLQHGSMRKKGQYIPSSVVPLSRGKDEKRLTMDLDLNPSTITLPAFTALLTQYEATVKAVTRTKALAKSSKGKKSKPNKRSASAAEDQPEKKAHGHEDANDDVTRQVRAQVNEFAALDAWRYTALPGLVEARASGGGGGKEGKCHLSKGEVVKLMEWKLKHGIYRPTLLSLVRSNQEKSIQNATSSAFSQLQGSASTSSALDGKDGRFQSVQKNLESLTNPLRGVGPATASLILSVASREVPFYSDDVYLWLCVGVYPSSSSSCSSTTTTTTTTTDGGEDGKEKEKAVRSKELRPNGELNVKYNVSEYRRLWEAVQRLRGRLNEGAGQGEAVSCADVEKVALVVRNFDQSRYSEGVADEEEEEGDEGDEGGKRKKRRVHD
ncbi:hypothetical protein BDW62DRAFT_213656 [Aspergillus aurantiobrunneus]